MNYIVFDLEWNQSPGEKGGLTAVCLFEIIEIGAIKLNEEKEIVDSFQRLIKPQVYNWIHDSIHEVIHMNYKDLQKWNSFPTGHHGIFGMVWRRIYFLYLGEIRM